MARLTSKEVKDGRAAWYEVQNRIVEKLNRQRNEKQDPGVRPEGADEIPLANAPRLAASDVALLDDLLTVVKNFHHYLPDDQPRKFFCLTCCLEADERALDMAERWMKRSRDKRKDVWLPPFVASAAPWFTKAAEWFDHLATEVGMEEIASPVDTSAVPADAGQRWDRATRDALQWMYDEAMNGTAWETIRIRLKQQPKSWPQYESMQGVRLAVQRYAKTLQLPPPPTRQPGRKKTSNK